MPENVSIARAERVDGTASSVPSDNVVPLAITIVQFRLPCGTI
ncbi:MAG TPA: hypothetical protein VNG51_27480 [Ktedonobacteraceae bacterium]|nr:hypothetical protein [Ktedonobacteraceae bacterium]